MVAVPKKDGNYFIILDLSSPSGQSVNDGISYEQFSVKYSGFGNVVVLVCSLGTSAFMATLDVQCAFRLCLVWPDYWYLLEYCWQGEFYVDT